MKKYRRLVLGGTFDHLHLGHQMFLDKAFSMADKVDIGLINNFQWLKKKKFNSAIEPFLKRKSALNKYLRLKDYLKRSTIIPLEDIYGNTLIEKNLQVILVTKQTFRNALLINNLREKNRIKKMDIIEMKIQNDKNEQIISSERIRRGEINRDGFIYFDLFKKKELALPEKLRSVLQKPLGKVYPKLPDLKNNNKIIVSVGDIVSQSFIDKGIIPDVRIVDNRSRRKPISKRATNLDLIINQPGRISRQVVIHIKKNIRELLTSKKKSIIVIKGEEDLLVLPVVMLLPLGASVYYGQFDVGVVEVEITEKIKEKARNFLELFI